MADLLENELVQKYFGECGEYGFCGSDCIARRVLSAMKKPIVKGDLILERFQSNADNEWQVMKSPKNFEAGLHEAFLRLPDRFQTKKEIEMSPMPCGRRWVKVLECENPVHNPAPEPEKCGHLQCVGSKACWKEPQKPDPIAEYRIQFSSHGDSHEAKIDLGSFAEALKPYLARKQP